MATAYQTLQNNVTDLSAKLAAAQKDLQDKMVNPEYLRLSGILSRTDVNTRWDAWVDINGVFYTGGSAGPSHNAGLTWVNNWKATIGAAQTVANDLKNRYDQATNALADYEKNSPVATTESTAQAAIATITATNTGKILTIVAAVVIGLIIIFGIVAFFKERKKYSLTEKTLT